MYFCAEQEVGLHLISGGGRYLGSLDTRQGSIQRRIGQYKALTDEALCLQLARQLVTCRGQSQRKFLMRGQRGTYPPNEKLEQAIEQMQRTLKQVPKADSIASLLGLEGNLAALYFGALPSLISDNVALGLRFQGRNRRPPKDRFNALLSFGYSMLLKDVNEWDSDGGAGTGSGILSPASHPSSTPGSGPDGNLSGASGGYASNGISEP